MNIPFPEYVIRIISCLADAGYDSYAVGGCIRDSIIGRDPHDWDVTTAAEPNEVVRLFSESDIHVIGTAGIRHGTVMVKAGDHVCEITTFRSDGDYDDHRRPSSVTFSKNVEKDLSRRDFTMNAIAAKPEGNSFVIVDPFFGWKDIHEGIIRTVGDPVKRFTEDALRIMRAVRFSAELGFSVEERTAEAAIELRDTLGYVSSERITSELWRIMSAENAVSAIRTFPEIFEWLNPGGNPHRLCEYIDASDDPYVRLALMLEHGSDGSGFFGRMRFPAKTKAFVMRLVSISHMPYSQKDVCELLRCFGDRISAAADYLQILKTEGLHGSDFLSGEALLKEADDIIARMIPYSLSQLCVNGSDIISAGISPESVGTVLEKLLSDVQNGIVLNEKSALLKYLKEYYILN